MCKYHVVERAGQDGQHTVHENDDISKAFKYVTTTYTTREMESRRVDVMIEMPDGSLSTEF